MNAAAEDEFGLVRQLFSNCSLYRYSPKGDERGSLIALEKEADVPFNIERVYYLYGQGPDVERGFHAHQRLRQLAVCVTGSCRMRLYDGSRWDEVLLDSPELGLYLGPMIWREIYDFANDTVLVVMASEPYDESEYIRSRAHFEALVEDQQRG